MCKGGVRMNSRIKQVRLALNLSQDEFGRRLGVTRGAITNIEFNKTEPKQLFVELLCREFDVNEAWLRTGEGEMFIKKSREEEIAAFVGNILKGEPDFRRRLVSVLARLSVEEWQMLERMAKQLNEE